jgi:hypothetical protein
VDSDGRPLDPASASRTRVQSRVSFADALNVHERRRTQSTLSRNRLDSTAPGHDDYGLEMQDALPALARESFFVIEPFGILTPTVFPLLPVMRTHSNELGHDGVAFPSSDGGHVFNPRTNFIPVEYSPGSRGSGVGSYFGSAPVAEHGETPDEALKRVAAQRRDSSRGSDDDTGRGGSGILGSFRRGLDRLRK